MAELRFTDSFYHYLAKAPWQRGAPDISVLPSARAARFISLHSGEISWRRKKERSCLQNTPPGLCTATRIDALEAQRKGNNGVSSLRDNNQLEGGAPETQR